MLHDPNWDKKPAQLDKDSLCLIKAADYIEERGWWNGRGNHPATFSMEPTPLCMVMALFEANHDEMSLTSKAFSRLQKFLGVRNVAGWNDAHTKVECIKALRDLCLCSGYHCKI